MLEIIFGCFYFQKMLVLCSFLAGCSDQKIGCFRVSKVASFLKKSIQRCYLAALYSYRRHIRLRGSTHDITRMRHSLTHVYAAQVRQRTKIDSFSQVFPSRNS